MNTAVPFEMATKFARCLALGIAAFVLAFPSCGSEQSGAPSSTDAGGKQLRNVHWLHDLLSAGGLL